MTANRLTALCVFCGSRTGRNPSYITAARDLGRVLALRDIVLVYGGGRVGLMGEVADAALQAGGRVVGVIPQMLIDREVGHTGLSDLQVVTTLSERKQRMADLADAFVALPGAIGTLDELFEVWTWNQLYRGTKTCSVLNVAGYFDPLLTFLDRTVSEEFLRPEFHSTLLIASGVDELLDRLQAAASFSSVPTANR